MTEQKTILITGASSGIGWAAAELFLQRGWNVVATARNPKSIEGNVDSERMMAAKLDVTDRASIAPAIAAAVKRFGRIDVLLNNAGYGLAGAFEQADEPMIRQQIETNVLGLMAMTQAVLPQMRQQGSGTIINMSSMAGRIGIPLESLYSSTKFAVDGFSEALWYELNELGIRVKAIEPGAIKTNFYTSSMKHTSDAKTIPAYTKMDEQFVHVLAGAAAHAPGPERVAQTIYRAATDGKSKLRYTVTSIRLVFLRKLLPDWLFMRAIRRSVLK